MVTDFNELPCKVNLFKIEKICCCHLVIKICFVCVELIEIGIEKVTVVIVHLNLIEN